MRVCPSSGNRSYWIKKSESLSWKALRVAWCSPERAGYEFVAYARTAIHGSPVAGFQPSWGWYPARLRREAQVASNCCRTCSGWEECAWLVEEPWEFGREGSEEELSSCAGSMPGNLTSSPTTQYLLAINRKTLLVKNWSRDSNPKHVFPDSPSRVFGGCLFSKIRLPPDNWSQSLDRKVYTMFVLMGTQLTIIRPDIVLRPKVFDISCGRFWFGTILGLVESATDIFVGLSRWGRSSCWAFGRKLCPSGFGLALVRHGESFLVVVGVLVPGLRLVG